MKFFVDSKIFENYPGLAVGLLVVKGCNNTGSHPEIADALRDAEAYVRSLSDFDPLNDYPKIASLREAHRTFGSSPKKYPPSIQALLKRVIKGGQLPSINPLVDLYNVISLRHIVPAGGEDIGACSGDIRLTYADGGEEFYEIGSSDNKPAEAGEVLYKDDAGAICRKFNWREADRTKLTEQTSNAVLVIEALPPVTHDELTDALRELQEYVEKYCGGEVEQCVLREGSEEVEL